MASSSGRSLPSSAETRCITWEYRSTYIRSFTLTEPYSLTRPRSLRPKIDQHDVLGALFFVAAASSARGAWSSDSSLPRGCVPAMGRYSSLRSVTRTSISGDEPSTCMSPMRKKYR